MGLVLVLSGCLNSQTPVDKLYSVLEQVVIKEKEFEEQQEPLVNLEKEEKVLYDKIISLGMKEYDEIVKVADEAIQIIEKRSLHMEKEQQSIQSSKKEFQKVTSILEEMDETDIKDKAEELSAMMESRYQIHEELFKNYTQGIKYDIELYEMFKNKDIQLEQLEEQIIKINEVYQKVLENNEDFNKKTEEYNKKKLEFYKAAGIEIKETT
jgi:tetratricopeptide (TPR) repeat protein